MDANESFGGVHAALEGGYEEVIEIGDMMDAASDSVPLDTVGHTITSEVLQYAYQNNLVTDHLLNSFSLSHLLGTLIQTTFPQTEEDGFTDSTNLIDLEVPEMLLRENLSLTDSACRLISQACHVPSDEQVEDLTQRAQQSNNTSAQKLELPLLRSENDWDLRMFKKEQLARSRIPIKDHGLPLDTPDTDAGEGMELATTIVLESDIFFQKLQEERLRITKDALKYLADQLKVDDTTEDLMSYLIAEANHEKASRSENSNLKKLTPPVSPKLAQNYFVPSTEACLIPMPSDDSSLLDDNFKVIEDDLLAEDQGQWSEITTPIRELIETEYLIEEGASIPQGPEARLEDLKVEIPLMLDSTPQQPIMSGEDTLKVCSLSVLMRDSEFDTALLDDITDDFLGEAFKEAAEETARSVEQEQLQQVDAVARVPVPVMDFSILEPGWVQLRMNDRGIFKWVRASKEDLFNPPPWHVHRSDESKLIWKALSAGVDLIPEKESLDYGEGLVQAFTELADSREILTSANLVERANRFLVLQNEDNDEEIETQIVQSKPQRDLLNFVRKRSNDVSERTTQKKPRRTTNKSSTDQPAPPTEPSLLLGDVSGASGKLLANFMEINAPKKKWSRSVFFAPPKGEPAKISMKEKKHDTIGSFEDVQALHFANLGASRTTPRITAPCPIVTLPSNPLTIFISIQIPRRLIRKLEILIPCLKIIERDYNAHNTSVWSPGSVARSVMVPPMAGDADISVSPSTGIIVTNMIRVRQKPRTGMNQSSVQDRIGKASLRYNRLVVLVGGEGGDDDALLQMSSSDSVALTEMIGFTTGLDCELHVHYVGGGDSTLADWVAFFLCKYGIPEHGLQTNLLEIETLWELFLRRAGLNVYAAQALVSQLKPIGNGEMVRPEQHGLCAFVTMTRAERLRRFGKLVGLSVLERVSEAIDEIWNRG